MKNYVIVCIIFLSFAPQIVLSQQSGLDHVNLFLAYNTIDSLIGKNELVVARDVYEAKKKEGYYISSWRQYEYSEKLYFEQGETELARQEMLESVKKGHLNFMYLYEADSTFLEKIEDQYGLTTAKKAIAINDTLTCRVRKEYGYLIDELIELNALDHQLYINKSYKKYRDYWFSKTFGFPVRDTTLNHTEAMAGYWEFRHKDSLKTERFVRLIDSLGYVPDERITGGLTANVLDVHSCKYEKLSSDVDSIYINSLRLGTMFPDRYAWYRGFYDERHAKDHTYYYTVGRKKLEDLPKEEKEQVDIRRKAIGLRPCPAVMWNNKIY